MTFQANRFQSDSAAQRIFARIDKSVRETLQREHRDYAVPPHADAVYERVNRMLSIFERPENHIADLVDIAVSQYKADTTGERPRGYISSVSASR